MIILCDCCGKPIERLNEIQFLHKGGCPEEEEIVPEAPKPEIVSAFDAVKVVMLPDGRMTPQNAALYLQLSTQTLATYRCKGGGPEFIKPGGKIFYYQADLDEWLKDFGKSKSTAQARFKSSTKAKGKLFS